TRDVADVFLDFGDVPPVLGFPSGLKQVFLNLIVNAAHAVADVVGQTGQRGSIRVRTAREGNDVLIAIEDTGAGIPDAIREHMFDLFFTTKGIGRGSGQ